MKRLISRDLDKKQMNIRQKDYADLQKSGYKLPPQPECYFLKGIREKLNDNKGTDSKTN